MQRTVLRLSRLARRGSASRFRCRRLMAAARRPKGRQKIAKGRGLSTGTGLLRQLKLSSPEDIVEEDPSYNRWLQVPSSFAVHVSIGSVFAFSIFNAPLTTSLGVVSGSAGDWLLGDIVPVFGTAMSVFGASALVFGRSGFYERMGPRVCGLLGAVSYGAAFSLSALAVEIHSLPLLYAGYGVLGGVAMGVSYVPAVSGLLKWFEDRKGLATGMAVLGFGGAGIAAAALAEKLLGRFCKAPERVADSLEQISAQIAADGRIMADLGERGICEVVTATAGEAAAFSMTEGIYLVGSGSTGVSETLMCMGAMYGSMMSLGALQFRIPSVEISRKIMQGAQSVESDVDTVAASEPSAIPEVVVDVRPEDAMKTRNFWCIWSIMGLNCTATYSIFTTAKTLMIDAFGSSLPGIVTAAFAGTFVSVLSASNLSGRIIFSTFSDRVGRKLTGYVLWGGSTLAFAAIPFSIAIADGTVAPLSLFVLSTSMIVAFFGGSAAILPAYAADVFGTRYVAGIHGQILSVLIPAGYVGPMTVAFLRQRQLDAEVRALAAQVEPEKLNQLASAAGAGPDVAGAAVDIELLIQSKILTIEKLLTMLPPGTPDPTPHLYDTTMLVMAAFNFICVAANWAIQTKTIAPARPKG